MIHAGTIRQSLTARPFTVTTASGRDSRVPSPEHAFVTRGGGTLIVGDDDIGLRHIDTLEVESIAFEEPLPGATP